MSSSPQRLFVDEPLESGASLILEGPRAHYLAHVLRLKPGREVRLFNAASGEFAARIARITRHTAELAVEEQRLPPTAESGPVLHFAPIRQSRLDWLVEKAVELGAARLVPVITRFTQVKPGRPERIHAIAVEAAEQCGRLTVPEVEEPRPFGQWLDTLRPTPLFFADEAGDAQGLIEALGAHGPGDLLVGPEGGFASEERAALRRRPHVVPITLGPRILRTETAALAALSVWQAVGARR
jgi:16S rRNA (uracil1498-N3)-methyltransferase